MVASLAGYRWYPNDVIAKEAAFSYKSLLMEIKFTYGGVEEYLALIFNQPGSVPSDPYIRFGASKEDGASEYATMYLEATSSRPEEWVNKPRYIDFFDNGSAVTDQSLIIWLSNNGTLVNRYATPNDGDLIVKCGSNAYFLGSGKMTMEMANTVVPDDVRFSIYNKYHPIGGKIFHITNDNDADYVFYDENKNVSLNIVDGSLSSSSAYYDLADFNLSKFANYIYTNHNIVLSDKYTLYFIMKFGDEDIRIKLYKANVGYVIDSSVEKSVAENEWGIKNAPYQFDGEAIIKFSYNLSKINSNAKYYEILRSWELPDNYWRKFYVYDNSTRVDSYSGYNVTNGLLYKSASEHGDVYWGYWGVELGITLDGVLNGKKNTDAILQMGVPTDYSPNIWGYIKSCRDNKVGGCCDWYIFTRTEHDILRNARDSSGNPFVNWYSNNTLWSSVEADSYNGWRSSSSSWAGGDKSDYYGGHSCFAGRSF